MLYITIKWYYLYINDPKISFFYKKNSEMESFKISNKENGSEYDGNNNTAYSF